MLALLTNSLLALCTRLSLLQVPIADLIALLLLLLVPRRHLNQISLINTFIDNTGLRVVLLQFNHNVRFFASSSHKCSC